jgi:hypothetical protein
VQVRLKTVAKFTGDGRTDRFHLTGTALRGIWFGVVLDGRLTPVVVRGALITFSTPPRNKASIDIVVDSRDYPVKKPEAQPRTRFSGVIQE